MLTVLNVLIMCSATVVVRSGGLFLVKPVAMVLFMLCSSSLVEWLLLKPCCVEIVGCNFFAITKRSAMGLYDVPKFLSLFGFGIGMMFAIFHV